MSFKSEAKKKRDNEQRSIASRGSSSSSSRGSNVQNKTSTPHNIFIDTIIRKFDSQNRFFVIANGQGQLHKPIIYCNEAFCQLTRFKRHEIMQRPSECAFLHGPMTQCEAVAKLKNALSKAIETHVRLWLYRSDGESFLCNVIVTPVRNGDLFLLILTFEEIHDTHKSKKNFKMLSNLISMPFFGSSSPPPTPSSTTAPAAAPATQSPPSRTPSSTRLPNMAATNETTDGIVHVPSANESDHFIPDTLLNKSQKLTKQKHHHQQEKQKKLSVDSTSSSNEDARRTTSSGGRQSHVKNSLEQQIRKEMNNLKSFNSHVTNRVAQVFTFSEDFYPVRTASELKHSHRAPLLIMHYSSFKAAWDWMILLLVIYTACYTPFVMAFLSENNNLKNNNSNNNNNNNKFASRFFTLTNSSSSSSDSSMSPMNKSTMASTQQHHQQSSVSTTNSIRANAHHIFQSNSLTPLIYIDLIVDITFLVDILINFCTTYVDKNDKIVASRLKIATNYLRGWFIIDMLAAVPFDLLFGNTAVNSDRFYLASLFKTPRLLRLVRVARKFDRYIEYGTAVLFLFLFLFCLVAHWLACIWYAIANSERRFYANTGVYITWLDQLAAQTYQPYVDGNFNGPSLTSKYITALYFTFSSLTSVGFGNISPNTNSEKLFSISVMLIGSLMYASIFGNVSAIVQRLYSSISRYQNQMLKVKEFIRFHQIPNPLRSRLQEYFHHAWSYTNGIDMTTVLNTFPDCLQEDICLHLNRNLFSNCSAFENASSSCLKALSMKFKTTHAPPDDTIVDRGDCLTSLYFISRGSVEILNGNRVVVAILGKHDTFGENCAVHIDSMGKSSSYVRALTYCDLHKISRVDLHDIIQMYPEFGVDLARDLHLTFDLRDNESVHQSPRLLPTISSRRSARDDNGADVIVSDSDSDDDNNSLYENYMMYSRDGGCDTKSKATIGTGRRHKRVLSSLVDASQIEHRARVDHKLDELNKRLVNLETKLTHDIDTILNFICSLNATKNQSH